MKLKKQFPKVNNLSIMKNTAHSILELAFISEGSNFKDAIHRSLTLAIVAEENNYKRFWFAEHHNAEIIASNATSLLMGYVAENTDRIRVGSGGIMLPNHSPLIVAEQFGTLAQMYPDRIDLGLGRAPGTDMQTAEAIRSDFRRASGNFLNEVEKIENYFSIDNKTSKVRAPIAEGTNVPIYILGSSPDSAHLAASKGLPYAFASHFAAAHLFTAIKIYKEEFQASQTLEKPYVMAAVNIVVADSDEEAKRIHTSLVKMFYGALTGKGGPIQPAMEMSEELKMAVQHPSLQNMIKYSFVGNRATVKSHVKEFIEQTGVDELIMVSTIHSVEDRLKSTRLFAEIMNEINEENISQNQN